VSPLAFSVVGCGGAQSPAVGEREQGEEKGGHHVDTEAS
jgi:hypothetical protein